MRMALPIVSWSLIAYLAPITGEVLDWVVNLGGSGADYANGIAVDSAGNTYTTGFFHATADFDPGPGNFNLTTDETESAFVCKLSPAGTLLWAVKIGGKSGTNAKTQGNAIALDSGGNVYVAGVFQNTVDFDPGAGIFELTSSDGSFEAFLLKLNSGGGFQWAVRVGGEGADGAQAIAVDSADNIWIAGYFTGTVDFDPGAGTSEISADNRSLFVLKLDSESKFQWAGSVETSGTSILMMAEGVAVDSSDNVYITGTFGGTAYFNPANETFELTASGQDAFLLKLYSNGTFQNAAQIGGGGTDYGYAIAVDSTDDIIITGKFEGTADFDPGPGTFELTSLGGENVFVLKLSSSGVFQYAVKVVGIGRGIAVDSANNIHVIGGFKGNVDFYPGQETFFLSSTTATSEDTFVLKLDSDGGFLSVFQFGGTEQVNGGAVAVGADGATYAAGRFAGTLARGAAESSGFDAFVLKLLPSSATNDESPCASILTSSVQLPDLVTSCLPSLLPFPFQGKGASEPISPVVNITFGAPTEPDPPGAPPTPFTVTFDIPFSPDVDTDDLDVKTALSLQPGDCVNGVLRRVATCEYWNEDNLQWQDDGCEAVEILQAGVSSYKAGVRCVCTHLTLFSIQERTVEIPNPKGDFMESSSLVSIVVVGSAFFALMVAHKVWSTKSKPWKIFFLVFSWFDFLNDMGFTYFLQQAASNCEVPEMWPFVAGFAATVGVGLLLSGLLSWLVLKKEIASNLRFSQWSQTHRRGLIGVWFLSLPNPSDLELLCSNLFGSELLSAPTSVVFERNVFAASFIPLLLREASQVSMLLVMVVQWGTAGTEELVPLAVSGTLLLVILARKVWKIRGIGSQSKAEDKRAAMQLEPSSNAVNL